MLFSWQSATKFPTFSTSPWWVGEKRVILGESLASCVGFCDPSKHVVEPFVETWGLVVNHARSQAKSQTIRHHLCRIFMLRGLLQKADLFWQVTTPLGKIWQCPSSSATFRHRSPLTTPNYGVICRKLWYY